MRPLQVIALFAGVSAAISWQGAFEDSALKAVEGIEHVERLFRRQVADETATSAEDTATSEGTTARATATGTGTDAASGTAAASGTVTESAAETTSFIDPRSPAGGVSMMVPDLFAGAQYYKVGEWVTFAWNFTSVQNQPSAVNVLATCSSASAQWTIAANMSYEPTQTVLWDTNQYAARPTPQLIMATYTLIIENADEAKATAIASPGELGTVNQFTFGMYIPQPYVPWTDFNCPTCNAALSGSDRQALGFMFAMVSITVLSFTWLSTGTFGAL